MAATVGAVVFDACLCEPMIGPGGDGARQGLPEAWPAGSAVVFPAAGEQRRMTGGTEVSACAFFSVERAAARRFGAFLEENMTGTGRKLTVGFRSTTRESRAAQGATPVD